MAVIAMKQLLEAGVHFGHQTRRWDPKMAEYIFQARNGIHIIDLQKTSKKLDEAYEFMKAQAAEGKTVLFVGTKKQASECVKEAAQKCSMYYVDQRWLGGMLTNFDTIKSRVERLKKLETMQEDGTFDVLPKKEVAKLKNEMEKLEKNLGGIKDMTKIPGILFVVDPKKERIAILEAKKLNIPLIGLIDTNCNPEDLDYPIPGNDDAIRAVKLIADVMANAIIEGREGIQITMNVEETEAENVEELVNEVVEEVSEKLSEMPELATETTTIISETVGDVTTTVIEEIDENKATVLVAETVGDKVETIVVETIEDVDAVVEDEKADKNLEKVEDEKEIKDSENVDKKEEVEEVVVEEKHKKEVKSKTAKVDKIEKTSTKKTKKEEE